MERTDLPIAVLDSGVGGISVLRELVRHMPHEDFLYLGDSKNAPYGEKTPEEVLHITRENLKMLLARGIKALVLACNTATGAAARTLRAEFPDLILVGIEPALKPASLLGDRPRVLVMATPLTLKQEKFCTLMARFCDDAEILPLACSGLVELIEAGQTSGEKLENYLKTLFFPHRDTKIDAVVLGCTHYPHVKETIAKILPAGVAILDGSEGTARETRRRLAEKGLLKESGEGRVTIENSSGDERLLSLSRQLLERE
ncbi:MAG: glutamate racemase [Ruminococcaceae bacterium]|nr:glutamate racemase [Oscillospiraceae bacterium]